MNIIKAIMSINAALNKSNFGRLVTYIAEGKSHKRQHRKVFPMTRIQNVYMLLLFSNIKKKGNQLKTKIAFYQQFPVKLKANKQSLGKTALSRNHLHAAENILGNILSQLTTYPINCSVSITDACSEPEETSKWSQLCSLRKIHILYMELSHVGFS